MINTKTIQSVLSDLYMSSGIKITGTYEQPFVKADDDSLDQIFSFISSDYSQDEPSKQDFICNFMLNLDEEQACAFLFDVIAKGSSPETIRRDYTLSFLEEYHLDDLAREHFSMESFAEEARRICA